MTQDELKTLVGQAALQYVIPGEIVGVGTGSTVNKFIDALAALKDQIPGAVSSSEASTARLKALGIPVFEANAVGKIAVYIDGADEIDANGFMDVTGLQITDPLAFENQVNQWPGVVTVGVFAHQKASVCLLGTVGGVKTLNFSA